MTSIQGHGIKDLLYVMARLRDPEYGCPWDRKQDFQSISSHTLEEAYEVIDAIEREDYLHLKDELGDLLFQVVFYGQLGSERDYFSFEDIVDGLILKLVKRHPHVFPEGNLRSFRHSGEDLDNEEIKRTWESIKQKEREQRGEARALGDVPKALSALMRANKLQARAANLKFDWLDYRPVVEKIHEELGEVLDAMVTDQQEKVEEEVGDLIFASVNLARHLGVDSERALRVANSKFERRFDEMTLLAEGRGEVFASLSLEQKNALWDEVKQREQP